MLRWRSGEVESEQQRDLALDGHMNLNASKCSIVFDCDSINFLQVVI